MVYRALGNHEEASRKHDPLLGKNHPDVALIYCPSELRESLALIDRLQQHQKCSRTLLYNKTI
jgi:hypothetical protein